ncbi:E3 ubiquitin-protein ligase TRIM39-like [Pristis pectinata]|uniref:E3 ubiquitin-protein ligase TRIM39-like n=1 Tax=Pristis pectinata TaxID=685728 RepID=UPI00223D8B7D|nr:E3 ubiquitin-protein ligase TRIM39-like [Pristis pectinata]
MNAGWELENMRKEVTCSICLDFYRDPQTIDCGHNFCRACIVLFWSSAREEVSCPQCREVFPQPHLRPNCCVSNLAESVRRLLPGQKEEVLRWEQEEKLAKALDRFQELTENLHRSQREEEANAAKLKKLTDELRKNIEYEFAKLHRFLNDEETILMTKLKQKEQGISAQIQENLRKNSEELAFIEEVTATIQRKVCAQEAGHLEDISDIIERSSVVFNQPTKVSVDLDLGDFHGPLQYAVWKRMLGAISPVPTALTLDPKTANPFLKVSEDWTEVRLVKDKQDVEDNAKRFTACLCVLGAEVFTVGRHYWEVEVANNTAWIIGVAKGSVQRKKDITLKPANGFWAMELFLWKYQALTSPPTHLPLKRRPKKVGVYLDYTAGQVSLCDADDMSHLYTFSDVFTGTLLPFFWTACKEGSLKLPTLQV